MNVDGVVLGVRRLARVMQPGGRIVCTASLAGLTAVPEDPIYAATKHAVVGFVRSAAAALEARGISINAVCPGFVDTSMVDGELRGRLEEAGFPLLATEEVAEAAWVALTSGDRRVTPGRSSPAARRSTSASRRSPARAPRTTSPSACRRLSRRSANVRRVASSPGG